MPFSFFGSAGGYNVGDLDISPDSNFGLSHDRRRDEFLSSYTLDDLGLKDSAGLALADVTESQRKTIEEEERKRNKRQMWALAIPAITAALTAKDSGQIQRALESYGQLLDSALARRTAVKEKEKDREARKEEFTTSTELEKARQEEIRRSNVAGEGLQKEGLKVQERGQDISASTQIRGQNIQLYNATQDRELTREQADENRKFQVELESIQNRHRKDQMAYGAELNEEAVIRNTAIELRDRILTSDPNIDEMVAISAADKLARGETEDLLEDERNALKLYRIHASEKSSAEKARAALNLFTDAMKVPVAVTDEKGNPRMTADGRGGTEPLMRLPTPEEALGFVTDARKFLDDIISSPINEDELKTGDPDNPGPSVGEEKDREARQKAIELLKADSEAGRKTRAALATITSPILATTIAVGFYENMGLAGAKALVDASNIPDGFKKQMIKAIEERDILEHEEKDPVIAPGSNPGSYLGR